MSKLKKDLKNLSIPKAPEEIEQSDPAFPIGDDEFIYYGISRREYFASHAPSYPQCLSLEKIVEWNILYADTMVKMLDKKAEEQKEGASC